MMKFIIYKTSQGSKWRGASPCQQAKFNDEDEYWYIEIESISQLLTIAKSNNSFNPGEIIISTSDLSKSVLGYDGHIEIYDDYRE